MRYVFVPAGFVADTEIELGTEEAHHLRVLRLDAGAEIGLVDGRGTRGRGRLLEVGKKGVRVVVLASALAARPPAVHLMVPVADRDRMLWLAEKVTELELTTWQPILFARSRGVSPRGEGTGFAAKVEARMKAALEQSGGAWLPDLREERGLSDAVPHLDGGTPRIVLDPAGAPIARVVAAALEPGITVVVGPEGGFEQSELGMLENAGFVRASLGDSILRFETAAVAALSVVRAMVRGKLV